MSKPKHLTKQFMNQVCKAIQNLGDNIYALRKAHGLSMVVVANGVKISRSYYSKIEKGTSSARLSTIYRIAEYYKADPLKLFEPLKAIGSKAEKTTTKTTTPKKKKPTNN